MQPIEIEKIEERDWEEAVVRLLAWFDGNKRALPWRESPTPYHVWISEIMLQQTRVEAVKPYYERFLRELPDVKSLAQADEETLLKLWEGLGYYNRVRNMQKAAIQVMEEYGGEIPDSCSELLKLKGIGSYTAGAIASIAYGRREPAVDGNVMRVMMRFSADRSDIARQSVKTSVENWLRVHMPEERSGDFNQALMELGAVVCVPAGEPLCKACPLKEFCAAKKAGSLREIPVKSAKRPRKTEEKTVFIIRDGERTAICRRGEKGLLSGMYEFPNAEGYMDQEEALFHVKEMGFLPLRIMELEPSRHIFSHREWHMRAYAVKIEHTKEKEGYIFIHPQDVQDKYPIPSAFAAYTRYLAMKIGNEKFDRKDGDL